MIGKSGTGPIGKSGTGPILAIPVGSYPRRPGTVDAGWEKAGQANAVGQALWTRLFAKSRQNRMRWLSPVQTPKPLSFTALSAWPTELPLANRPTPLDLSGHWLSASNGQFADAVAAFLDDDNGSGK
jgi:hypothetical protein